MVERDTWDEYFMKIAEQVASRATCDRKHVGAVIVNNFKHILSTGYNGAIAGLEHCNEIGHMMEDNHCVRVVHAEANAICQAARNGVSLDGSTCYITLFPCWACFKLLINSGIKRIVYGEFYEDNHVFETAKKLGVKVEKVGTPEEAESLYEQMIIGLKVSKEAEQLHEQMIIGLKIPREYLEVK